MKGSQVSDRLMLGRGTCQLSLRSGQMYKVGSQSCFTQRADVEAQRPGGAGFWSHNGGRLKVEPSECKGYMAIAVQSATTMQQHNTRQQQYNAVSPQNPAPVQQHEAEITQYCNTTATTQQQGNSPALQGQLSALRQQHDSSSATM